MIGGLLKRWADAALSRRVLDLEAELEAARRTAAVADAEIESLAGVVARDRQRIQAECAAYARQRADAEGVADERTH